jgi:hypothetical protein
MNMPVESGLVESMRDGDTRVDDTPWHEREGGCDEP